MQLFCSLILTLSRVDFCQVMQTDGRIHMVWAKVVFAECQGLLIERFGLGILALRFIQICQIIERLSGVDMFGS